MARSTYLVSHHKSILLFAVTVLGGPIVGWGRLAGLLLRSVPGLRNNWHIDGNIATVVLGAGLLHALITAPRGVAGKILDTMESIRAFAGRARRRNVT